MRQISFALTTPQFKDRTKTVTRRNGWRFLKPGDLLQAVEKGMGLKKGEHPVKLGIVRVVSVRFEPLNAITQEDVIAEGFPDWTPRQFVEFYAKHNKCAEDHEITRIEFEYVDEGEKKPDLYSPNQFLKAIDTWRNLLGVVELGTVEFASNEPDEEALHELVARMRDAAREEGFFHRVKFWHGDEGIEFYFCMKRIEKDTPGAGR